MVSKYYWPKMKDDLNYQIKKCVLCNRHKKERIFNHPAIAIDPISVFDRIGIDLVVGFPVTEKKFLGILVITEYLTKFPYVVPIHSKEANEIAPRLFEYFSLFGPPRIRSNPIKVRILLTKWSKLLKPWLVWNMWLFLRTTHKLMD